MCVSILFTYEIPKAVSHFAALKILTENVGHNERYIYIYIYIYISAEATQEQKSTTATMHRAGGDEEMEEVAEPISRVYMKLTVQLESRMRDLESATHCALFLLRDSVNRDRHAKRRQQTTIWW